MSVFRKMMMPINFVNGDPLLTQCQTLAIGHNRLGRTENTPFSMQMMRHYPVAFASYERRCKAQQQSGGSLFVATQSQPQILFLTVRDSSVGATRLRHVQACLMTIARDYLSYGIKSLTIAPLGESDTHADIHQLLLTYFAKSKLQLIVYEEYQAGVKAEENLA